MSFSLKMKNVLEKNCKENQQIHFKFNEFSTRKSCRLCNNVEKYGRAGQVTDGNVIRRMRFGYSITKATDKLRIYDTFCFFTATTVKRTRVSVT
jgi:hypothetical protein